MNRTKVLQRCKSIWKATEGGQGMLKFQRAMVWYAELDELTQPSLECLEEIYNIFVKRSRKQYFEK